MKRAIPLVAIAAILTAAAVVHANDAATAPALEAPKPMQFTRR